MDLKQLLVNLDSLLISSGNGVVAQVFSVLTAIIKSLHYGLLKYTSEVEHMCQSLRSAANVHMLSSLEEISLPVVNGTESVLKCIGNAGDHYGLKRVYFNWLKEDCPIILRDLLIRERGLEELGIRARLGQIKDICAEIERAISNIAEEKRNRIQIKLRLRNDGEMVYDH